MLENENGLIMLTADDGSEEAFFCVGKSRHCRCIVSSCDRFH